MKTNEVTIAEITKDAEILSRPENADETQQEELHLLSKMFGVDESQPETLLITSAQRLGNLMHSLFEKQENEYLNSEQILRQCDSQKIEDICKLASTAAFQMKTALEFKKERVNALKVLHEIRNK